MDIGYKDISRLDSEEQFMGRINRSGRKSGIVYFFDLEHDVFIYGVDGSPNIKKLLAETKAIVGTSSQSPTSLGKETIKVAYKMLHHKKYKRSIIVPTKLITKENIEEYDITGWQ